MKHSQIFGIWQALGILGNTRSLKGRTVSKIHRLRSKLKPVIEALEETNKRIFNECSGGSETMDRDHPNFEKLMSERQSVMDEEIELPEDTFNIKIDWNESNFDDCEIPVSVLDQLAGIVIINIS